jgi:hypothetical protein
MALTASACREQESPRESLTVASAAEPGDTCAGSSLRPSAAAPAEGLWLYERPPSLAADKEGESRHHIDHYRRHDTEPSTLGELSCVLRGGR